MSTQRWWFFFSTAIKQSAKTSNKWSWKVMILPSVTALLTGKTQIAINYQDLMKKIGLASSGINSIFFLNESIILFLWLRDLSKNRWFFLLFKCLKLWKSLCLAFENSFVGLMIVSTLSLFWKYFYRNNHKEYGKLTFKIFAFCLVELKFQQWRCTYTFVCGYMNRVQHSILPDLLSSLRAYSWAQDGYR